MELPEYFPLEANRRLAGLQEVNKKKFSVVFQDYGRCGNVDVSYSSEDGGSTPTFTAQRLHTQPDREHLCALTPTVPLSDNPVKADYPFYDAVLGNGANRTARMDTFLRSVKRLAAAHKRTAFWSKRFLTAKRTLDSFSNPKRLSPFQLEIIEQNLPDFMHRLTDTYSDLSQQPLHWDFNPRYSGGTLSCLAEDHTNNRRHLLLHASGQSLDSLQLTRTSPRADSPLLTAQVLARRKVGKVFQVHATKVEDQLFVGTRHESSCSLFSISDITTENTLEAAPNILDTTIDASKPRFSRLGSYRHDSGVRPTSLTVSDYFPGEALISSDDRTVCIWDASRGIQREISTEPRFQCDDSWLHAYYGSHPRHVIVADRTAVRMVDHRDGFINSVDLLALPSKLVHKNELIMAAMATSRQSPLHVLATSHCLFLVDQRFAGSPVMQWYPDLVKPLQYLATGIFGDTASGRWGRGVILAGSQHPAEVMCYPFTQGQGHRVTNPLTPWRLSKMSDISDLDRYSCFLGDADASVFQQRVGLSLTGVAVGEGETGDSMVTYQADSYGEVYYQRYDKPTSSRTARKTGVPPAGERDEFVPECVQDHVRSWLQTLQKHVDSAKPCEQVGTQKLDLPPNWLTDSSESGDGEVSKSCCLCGEGVERLVTNDGATSTSGSKDRRPANNAERIVCQDCQSWPGLPSFQTASSGVLGQSSSEADFPQGAEGSVITGLMIMEETAPAVDEYDRDANTDILLMLMRGETINPEKVKEREDERARKLEDLKTKNQAIRDRRKRKREALEEDVDPSASLEHSVFNSEEHQKQNSLIQQILAKGRHSGNNKSAPALSEDKCDGNASVVSEVESSGLFESEVDGSCDLFTDGDSEEDLPSTQKSLFNNTQDDDDDFFTSIDLSQSTLAQY